MPTMATQQPTTKMLALRPSTLSHVGALSIVRSSSSGAACWDDAAMGPKTASNRSCPRSGSVCVPFQARPSF